jgi:hypothetical protein
VANNSTSAIIFKTYWLLVTAVNSIVASVSMTFYTTVCYVFYKEFEYVRRTFARKVVEMNDMAAIRGAQIGAAGEIERFRMSHQRRCKVRVVVLLSSRRLRGGYC